MLRQLKTDRVAQAMLAIVILVGCFACSIWGFSILRFTRSTPSASAPIAPTSTAAPTDTPVPAPTRSGIPVDRQDLVNHFDRKGFRWREATFKDGTHQLVGEAQSGTGKIVMWSTPDDSEDLIELFYSFTFPFEGGDNIRRTGVEEMFETMRIVLPGWEEGERWIPKALEAKESETVVNGMEISLELGDEEATQQFIVIFSVVE